MKKKTSISKNYIPQSNYRNSADKLLTEIDTKITAIGIKNPHKETLINKIKSIATLIHKIVTTKEQYEKKVVNEVIQLLFKSNKSSPEKSLEKQWEKIEAPVINILKVQK